MFDCSGQVCHERLIEIKERIDESRIEHSIQEASVIATGEITSVSDVRLPEEPTFEVREYTLRVESLLKGEIGGETIKFVAHWLIPPEPWLPYTPKANPGERWYVFLKERGSYFYPVRGANAMYRIEDGKLMYANRVEFRYQEEQLDELVSEALQ